MYSVPMFCFLNSLQSFRTEFCFILGFVSLVRKYSAVFYFTAVTQTLPDPSLGIFIGGGITQAVTATATKSLINHV